MTRASGCRCPEPDPALDGAVPFCQHCGELLPDPQSKLLVLVARQQQAILHRLDRLEALEPAPEPEHSNGTGRLVGPRELAEQLGRSPQWVREHAEQLGGFRDGDGKKPRYWFRPDIARERLATLGANGSKPAPAPQPKPGRRRRRSSEVELLPVKGARP